MILVKDLVKFLKNDITIIISLPVNNNDDNNISNLKVYYKKEHDNLTIKDINIINDKSIGFEIL